MNRSKITRLAFAIVFVCFLLSTFVSLWSLRLMAKQNMRELSKVLAGRIYDAISSELSEPIVVSRTMANDRLLIDVLEHEDRYSETEASALMSDYLTGIKEGMDYESAFVVSDATKRYYSFGGLSKNMDPVNNAYDQWYTLFIGKGKAYDLDVDRDELIDDAWTVFVNARIEDENGRLLGVCGVGVHMTGSQALFRELEEGYGVKINLIDSSGLIQVDTDESRIENASLEGILREESSEYVYQRRGGRSVITKYVEKLGWYLVVQSDGIQERSQVIHVIILNVALCLAIMVILVIAIRIIVERTKALSHASFRDQTTQLLNRRAFEDEKARLAVSPLDADFTYMTADLNGLKYANDNLGHAAGDELIRGAANCLKECFGRYGSVYRIGGDEFAAMLVLSEEDMKAAMEAFEKTTGEWSGEKVKQLSVSCGVATLREFPSENIAELSRIADERMYAAKEEYYRRSGAQRRQPT